MQRLRMQRGTPLPEFAAMTKAQIIAEVERRYGVPLDPGMTKAELVAEAERLASGGLTAEAEPDSPRRAPGPAAGSAGLIPSHRHAVPAAHWPR